MPRERPFLLAGEPAGRDFAVDVISPYDGALVGRTWLAGADDVRGGRRRGRRGRGADASPARLAPK